VYAYAVPNHTNGRPDRLFINVYGHRVLTIAYRIYLLHLLQVDEDEKRELRELGIRPTEDSMERIEDFPGTAAFIEGDRA